jgi:S-adenosylmethionine hydrolase
MEEAYVIENPAFMRPVVSPTFHGRDIFAATAARLAAGVDLHGVGPPAENLVTLPFPEPAVHEETVEGEIVHVDHFGNAVSNIPAELLAHWPKVRVEAGTLTLGGLSTTYADAAPGEPLALTGSTGYLEIAVNQGSARTLFNLECGTPVRAAADRR